MMPATNILFLFLTLFSAVFAVPVTLSDRLTKLEQQVKVHELAQTVKALSRENEVKESDAWIDFWCQTLHMC